jgi:hypothetical protein
MKRKSPIIQQGKVTELMSRLANLPEREKAPSDPVSLSEVFRTKEYITEIKTALKKGYTFENIAEIFSERCGVAVSARQIRYHFTRAKNRSVKGKSGKKSEENSISENNVSSADFQQTDESEDVKEDFIAPDSQTKAFSNVSGFSFENRATVRTEVKADSGAFQFDMRPKES